MKNFHYVYILTDIATETHHYVGSTQDLQARLAKHNVEKCRTHQNSNRGVFKLLSPLTIKKKRLLLKII